MKMGCILKFVIVVLCTLQSLPLGRLQNIPSTLLSKGKSHHRTARSPQFSLTGRNVLSDLTQQIKPPSINDLADFRQRVANLANFTALLEQAISAEQAARSKLQNFVDTMREQITGIQTAVNPDPENYWTESKECGGILVSQTGRIIYKDSDYYKDHERCVWAVRANYRSKIKVSLLNSGLEQYHDYVAVTELIEATVSDKLTWNSKRLSSGQTGIFNGPFILITFISDGTIRKNGFKLEFEGLGSNINTRTVYQHFHFTELTGQFNASGIIKDLQDSGVKIENSNKLVTTIVVNPVSWSYSLLNIIVPESDLDLRPELCEKTRLSIFNDFTQAHGVSNRCCGKYCERNNTEISSGVGLALFQSSDLSDGNQFQMNWSTVANRQGLRWEDTCDGVLQRDQGEIRYKVNSPYANNERCLWVITGEKAKQAEMKIQLLEENFEHHYDYITLSYFKPQGKNVYDENDLQTIFLYKASDKPITVPASIAFVQFYSDAANLGTTSGFHLIWEVKYLSDDHVSFSIDTSSELNGTTRVTCQSLQDNLKDDTIPQFYVINGQNKNQEYNNTNYSGSGSGPSASILKIEGGSDANDIIVFKSEGGKLSPAPKTNEQDYSSVDGTFVVLNHCKIQSSDVVLKWGPEEPKLEAEVPEAEKRVTVKSVDQCGEVLYGDKGEISYKLGKEYDLNERCTWIIRAKSLATVSLRLMADGFESCCDGLQVNRVDTDKGEIDLNPIFINRENRFQTIEGPILLITLYSDHSVQGFGFALEFQTKGNEITSPKDIPVNHWHTHFKSLSPSPVEPFGPVFIQLSEKSVTIDVFQFEGRNETTATISMDNLETKQCDKDLVAFYHMPEITKYELLKRHPGIELLCPMGNPMNVLIPKSTLAFQQEKIHFKGLFLIVARIMEVSDEKSLSVSFQ